MRFLIRSLLISVLLIATQGCTDNKAQVTVSGGTFNVSATINTQFVKSGSKDSKIEGVIIIKNVATVSQKFETESLSLKVNGELTSRTFKESIPAENKNTGTIEINANSSLSFPAYWIYNVSADTKIKSLQLVLQESE